MGPLWIVMSCGIVYVIVITIYNFQPIYVETPISIFLISYQLLATNKQRRNPSVKDLNKTLPTTYFTIQYPNSNTDNKAYFLQHFVGVFYIACLAIEK